MPPSKHVDPATAAFGGEEPHELKVNVLLPDGYHPRRAYPLLYLLHGAGESHRSWADPERGRRGEHARRARRDHRDA